MFSLYLCSHVFKDCLKSFIDYNDSVYPDLVFLFNEIDVIFLTGGIGYGWSDIFKQ